MRSDKAVLGLPVPGARENRPQYGHYFSDEGLVLGAALLVTILSAEKSNSRTYSLSKYEVLRVFVCEIYSPKDPIEPTHQIKQLPISAQHQP